ncbi:Macrophage mannose receptor 1 [Oryzias melastigma]|uniref:Macrophage mannose receptor 1 n=1 Tax=Oryzias melastigma TaxID=30732 RepID=A0A834C5X8_ORYME|nr:Macrophage mannose receptor 1 [Oryzias melastigma]
MFLSDFSEQLQSSSSPGTNTARNMYPVWILWLFLLSGGRAFMIYSSEHSLCLQDSGTREVQLERCSLDSEAQQWLWINQSMLMSAATSRCLYTQWSDRVQMQSCHGLDPAGLEWDCYKGRLISRKTSLLLTASGQQVILSQEGKLSMWKSLDEEDFCEERLRLRRASGDLLDYEEDVEEVIDKKKAMTEEQRQFLRWFYRKEDFDNVACHGIL